MQSCFLLIAEVRPDQHIDCPAKASWTLSMTASEDIRNSADVLGVISSRMVRMNSSLMRTSVIDPDSAPIPHRQPCRAAGRRKIRPKRSPQKEPSRAPALVMFPQLP